MSLLLLLLLLLFLLLLMVYVTGMASQITATIQFEGSFVYFFILLSSPPMPPTIDSVQSCRFIHGL